MDWNIHNSQYNRTGNLFIQRRIGGCRMKPKIKEAYSAGYGAGYSAGISNTNCICKNWSPIEDYTVVRKEYLIFLLNKASKPGTVDDIFKEKKDEVS